MDRLLKKALILASLLIALPTFAGNGNIVITKAGAKAGLVKDNAPVIQKAIDKLSAQGGGTVTIPAGEFLTGPIELKSGVELHLDMGARLLGLADIEAYEKAHYVSPEGKRSPHSALIYANNQENIAITGLGTIDGQGGHPAFNVGKADPGGRPMIILFRECKNIVVRDVRLENSAHWVEYYTDCEGVRVSGIKVYSHCNYNNDGIDIESKDVVVENCIFDCEDDAICLKGSGKRLCENVSVSNCVAASNCNAIKLGTGSDVGYRNVTVSNITVRRASEDNFRHWSTKLPGISAPVTVISGIAVEVVDGGICENVNISNVAMRDVQTPIFIRMGRRCESDYPGGSRMKGISISGVTAVSESMMCSSITGVPGLYPEDISLSDISISAPGGGTAEMGKLVVPENEKSYPENRCLGKISPSSGLYIRHAKNVRLSNIRFDFREPDARPLVITDDCTLRWEPLNVMDFGAKGDGVTDDTPAIQKAIDFLDSRGGGKLFFPYTEHGYLLSSPAKEYTADGRLVRAQLILPAGDSNIQFEGEMPCKLLYSYQVRPKESVAQNFEPTKFGTMSWSNTCLHSTWDAPEVRDSLERPWAVIAAPEGDSCDGRFSRAVFSMKNLEIRVHLDTGRMYPTTSAAFLKNVSRLIVEDSQFCLDEQVGDTELGKSLQPNPCHTVGLHTSGNQNDDQILRNVAVQGFRYGFVMGEHICADYLYVHNCEEAVVFHDATHLSTIGHIVAQHNRVILSTTRGKMFGNTPAKVNLTIGVLNFEGGQTVPAPPEVSKLVYGVYDPDNRLRGSVKWHEPWGLGVFPVLGAKKYDIKKYR